MNSLTLNPYQGGLRGRGNTGRKAKLTSGISHKPRVWGPGVAQNSISPSARFLFPKTYPSWGNNESKAGPESPNTHYEGHKLSHTHWKVGQFSVICRKLLSCMYVRTAIPWNAGHTNKLMLMTSLLLQPNIQNPQMRTGVELRVLWRIHITRLASHHWTKHHRVEKNSLVKHLEGWRCYLFGLLPPNSSQGFPGAVTDLL